MKTFSLLLTQFFTERLIQQKQVSPNTISSYRDTFKLLLQFTKQRLGKEPSSLIVEEIDAPLISDFLKDLEEKRGISARTRNLRLTAIRSFFRYIAYELPDCSNLIQRILAIPTKSYTRIQICYLNREEVDALLDAPDQETWSGRRDHAWIFLAVQAGLRVSELTNLSHLDVNLSTGSYVHVLGKGRKERCTPITKEVKKVLKNWVRETAGGDEKILFPSCRGKRLSNDGIQYLLKKHIATASKKCPSLCSKRISPHVLRHTSAMELLHAGVDTSVIALWLGHESVETTQIYLEVDLAMKKKILEKTLPHSGKSNHYKPNDALLEFLKAL